ncbi:MAG TPA: hypothetical protein VEP91_04355 [Solirubrobacterales bacterium]|nr:hypothetical protein [Solirubrobacterales bacterium]
MNVKNAKAKVATGATVVLLGGLTGLALSQGGGAPSKPVADKPIVHTKVIRRTVHVTKHAKPKHPPAAAPVEPAASGSAAGGAYVATGSSGAAEGESAPVYTGSSGGESESAPVTTGSSGGGGETTPVTTATSGAGGGGGEVESDGGGGESEHEGGGDD